MTATTIFPFEVWTSQITQASIPANNNSLRVQVLNTPAISVLSSPPSSPTENDLYVIGASPSGSWSSFTQNNVCIYKGGTWLEFKAFKGWVKNIGNDVYLYNGSAWAVFAIGPTAEPWSYLYLTADFTNSTTTFTNITGLTFNVLANTKYEAEVFGAYQTPSTSTGLGLKINGPSDLNVIGYNEVFTSTNTIGGSLQNNLTDTTQTSTGVHLANTNSPIFCKFLIFAGATAGTVNLQMRSKTASSLVALKSNLFYLRYRKLP